MANSTLFGNRTRTLTTNEAGGPAYNFEPKHALAQLAATGCFNNTYYATDAQQFANFKEVSDLVDNEYLAKLAVYARQQGAMKDMPVALLLCLSSRNTRLFRQVFPRVINNGRTLRTFIQMLRSGVFGRRSLSHSLQHAVQEWLNSVPMETLLAASVGQNPSIRDVLRLSRPTPVNAERRAMFAWLTGKAGDEFWPDLPTDVRLLEAFRNAITASDQIAITNSMKQVRWDLLADTALPETWKHMAHKMGPQALRMNLNTLARHGAFDDPATVAYVAGRLVLETQGQFPYQYLAAYLNSDVEGLKPALNQAAEVACQNVPDLPPVIIGLDVSGSMSSSITGHRKGSTSKMRCVDIAALFAAAIVRRSPNSLIVPFDDRVHTLHVDRQAPILQLAEKLASYGGGGTNCALPLQYSLSLRQTSNFAGCILISDNESWIHEGGYHSTDTMRAWNAFKEIQPAGKLVCLDIQPYTTTQAMEREDILNIGGFSDSVFRVVKEFFAGESSRFVADVEATEI